MQFSTLQEVSGDLSLTWMGSAAAAAAGVLTEKHLRSMEVDWRRDIIVNTGWRLPRLKTIRTL